MFLHRLTRYLFHPLALMILVPLILSVVIWIYGPYLGGGSFFPFATLPGKILGIGAVWITSLMIFLISFLVRRRRERKMTEDIVEAVDTGPDTDEMVSGEISDLRDKLRTALTQLRKSKFGRRSLYELPWYVIIGPPGAGKTTAITSSGLNFPLAETMGKTAICGVGGTRNCDWWFTDNAVLIDTAGRYTTQDSDADTDNAGWLGFLDLLKKNRKRQPINGAMVAISISDISMQDEETQKSHARAIRRRLHELRERLGVRFPVYVLFTKADLIAGFAEFFDHLGKEEREQVWGFTLPLPKGKDESSPIAAFDEQFAGLLGRLNAQTLGKMQSEVDHQRRSLVAGFPGQVASVRQVARDFLSEVFQDNRFEHRHLLRGVYFASGTQEGTPIDRLMMGMARTFGIGRQAIGSGRGTGRSYFLTRLFEEVMFPEAGLVSADDKVERRYKLSLWGAVAATVVLAIGSGVIWTRSYLGNSALIQDSSDITQTYITAAAAIPTSPIGDTDIPAIVPALNTLRAIPTNAARGDYDPERRIRWGLYQGDLVGDQAAQSYRAALNQHFLPRLLLRLEEQMQSSINEPDVLYETLKIYLMLGQQGPLQKDLVMEWMRRDWEQGYAGLSREELRNELSAHLDTMLSQPMVTVPLNGPLVAQVRGVLAQMPMAQRIYKSILNSADAAALPQMRVTDLGGNNISRVMQRSSGGQMSDGIEGIYTRRGFQDVFLPQAIGVSQKIQNESWVLGEEASEQSIETLANTARDVLDLYYDDFVNRYDTLLADLDVIPLQSPSHAAEVTNVLSGTTSPIRYLLESISNETKLTEEDVDQTAEAVQGAAAEIAGIEIQSTLSGTQRVIFDLLAGSVVEAGASNETRPPGYYVQERFAWLHTLTEQDEGAPSQLDEIINILVEVYRELNKIAFSGGIVDLANDEFSALSRFNQVVAQFPGPLERWGTQISSGSSGITADSTRAQLDGMWQSQILPFCTQALDGRYPFNRRSQQEVKMQDFARLFAPGGLIDGFFEQNLRKHVDTTTNPWVWKTVNGADLGMSDSVLQQLQMAAQIRDTFFSGGAQASISFDLTPEALDPNAQQVLLEVDGTQVPFDHQTQPTPVKVTWPGQASFARIGFGPALDGLENTLSRDGDWGWFRLLDAAQIRKTNVSDRSRIIFTVGGRVAIFQLRAGSVLNPFSLPALQKFQCPQSL